MYLWKAEVDGNGFWDVEESCVGGEGDGEPVQALQDVGALVLLNISRIYDKKIAEFSEPI